MKKLTMKNLAMYGGYMLACMLLLGTYSCKQNAPDIGGVTDKLPENVQLLDYSNSSITVGWDRIEGATSYTAQLMGSKDGDKPLDSWIVVAEDQYQFSGLEELLDYYVRVRANVNYSTGDWVYIMNDEEPARIIPQYGIVDEDFVLPEPEPEPQLYPNFPEGWEVHTATGGRKSGFGLDGPATGGQSDIFPSGEWLMPNIYSLNASSTIQNRIGDWTTIFRGGAGYTPYLEMNFDLPNGASKFSFYYGTATQNATDTGGVPIYLTVEYSQDSGASWTQIGDILEIEDAEVQYFQEYELDITGPVRFRIGKNNETAARMMIDEIAVYYTN